MYYTVNVYSNIFFINSKSYATALNPHIRLYEDWCGTITHEYQLPNHNSGAFDAFYADIGFALV